MPFNEIQAYPSYFGPNRSTPLIHKDYKPVSAWDKAQSPSGGLTEAFQQPPHINLSSSQTYQPAHAFSEQIYQINMVLHPIHVIVLAIRQAKLAANPQ